MNEKTPNLIDSLINFIPALVAFLMPIFFLPLTSEFFEFNKLAFLTVAASLLVILWVLRMVKEKKVFITKSVLDMGFLVLLVSFVLSSVFSLHKVSSIFGSYGRWFPSLFGFVILAAFYYAVASNLRSGLRFVLFALVGGSVISTFVALLSYFGIKLGGSVYLQVPNFTLTGSSTTTAIVAVVGLLVTICLLVTSKNLPVKILLLTGAVLNFLGVILLGTPVVWVVLVLGILSGLYFLPFNELKANKFTLLALVGAMSVFVLLFIVPATRDVLINKNYPRELVLPAKESQVIAFSVLRDYPLLGTGPSTFYINYPNYKTLVMNSTPQWNIRFDKPYSEVFNLISSLGILGILAMVVFTLRALKLVFFAKRSMDSAAVLPAIGTGLVTMSLYFLFSYANVLTMFLLILFLAMGVAVAALVSEKRVAEDVYLGITSFKTDSSMSILNDLGGRKEVFPYIVSVPILGLVGFGLFLMSRMYLGEFFIRKSIVAATQNNGSLTYQMQAKAIGINPGRDTYHNAYAQTNLALANSLAGKQDLTDQEKVTIQTLIAQAIRNSRAATEVLNPASVANWETRALVYRTLVGVATDADQWAINAYNTAIQLDPANPRLRLDLGGLYYAKADYLSAASFFRQAASLKPDYANAHYNFGYSLMQLKAYPDAQREFEIVQRLVPMDSADYKRVSEDLSKAKEMAAQAGAQAQPTVEQIESSAVPAGGQNEQQREVQESLVRPGEGNNVQPLPVNPGNTNTPGAQ